ncbi:hypothetical protein F5887DRAFT_915163 [Amanita rubescens]|nr:hypothetical protein F5887DRAFT_915163 [Amanita rubescens]
MSPNITGKRVPILTERANAAIASSRKRRLSLSSQEGTDDIPRQRAHTSDTSPAMVTTANDSNLPPTTPANAPPHAAEAPEGTHEAEGDADETVSMVDSDMSNSSSVPATASRETPEVQLKRLQKEWHAPVYTFFQPTPKIVELNKRLAHEFKCIG